jgi:hypothetical protein
MRTKQSNEVKMMKIIINFKARLANYNYRVLLAEAVVLAVIIGDGLGSWPGVIILLLTLIWVLNRSWGVVYLIILYSCAWGFLAGMIGYGLFGWAWAIMLGGLTLISGVKIHCRDLRRPFVSQTFEQINENKWGQNWFMGRQNLN